MTADFKLYRKFYNVQLIKTGATTEQSYVLSNPYSLSANTYIAGSGDTESTTLIEPALAVSQDSLGIYFATMTPTLYAGDQTYDLVWYVNYTASAPPKKLTTRFRINNARYVNQIEVEYLNSPLEIQVLGSY